MAQNLICSNCGTANAGDDDFSVSAALNCHQPTVQLRGTARKKARGRRARGASRA